MKTKEVKFRKQEKNKSFCESEIALFAKGPATPVMTIANCKNVTNKTFDRLSEVEMFKGSVASFTEVSNTHKMRKNTTKKAKVKTLTSFDKASTRRKADTIKKALSVFSTSPVKAVNILKELPAFANLPEAVVAIYFGNYGYPLIKEADWNYISKENLFDACEPAWLKALCYAEKFQKKTDAELVSRFIGTLRLQTRCLIRNEICRELRFSRCYIERYVKLMEEGIDFISISRGEAEVALRKFFNCKRPSKTVDKMCDNFRIKRKK